ncbi:MAG: hypothetical protein ACE15F_05840 [bacterium]
MIRTWPCWLFYLGWQVAAVLSSASPQPLPSAAGVYYAYMKNAALAHHWKGTLQINYQRMYIRKVDDPLRKELEAIFSLPCQDPLYQTHPALYMKSHVQMNWLTTLDEKSLSGRQQLVDSYTHLTAVHPSLAAPPDAILRRLIPLTGLEFRFSFPAAPGQATPTAPRFLLPPELAAWHYPPNLWYPLPALTGFPKDLKAVQIRSQEAGSITYVYTPAQLDPGLLLYFRDLIRRPQLDLRDLTNILILDPLSNSCRSFSITCQADGKQRPLLSIAHGDADPALQPFPVPAISTLFTSFLVEEGDKPAWNTNYFCQMNLLRITPH